MGCDAGVMRGGGAKVASVVLPFAYPMGDPVRGACGVVVLERMGMEMPSGTQRVTQQKRDQHPAQSPPKEQEAPGGRVEWDGCNHGGRRAGLSVGQAVWL